MLPKFLQSSGLIWPENKVEFSHEWKVCCLQPHTALLMLLWELSWNKKTHFASFMHTHKKIRVCLKKLGKAWQKVHRDNLDSLPPEAVANPTIELASWGICWCCTFHHQAENERCSSLQSHFSAPILLLP